MLPSGSGIVIHASMSAITLLDGNPELNPERKNRIRRSPRGGLLQSDLVQVLLFSGKSHGSRAAITDGNWIDPTYLPSTRSAQRIKLPEIIAARSPGLSRLKSLRIREQQGEIPQAIRPSNSQKIFQREETSLTRRCLNHLSSSVSVLLLYGHT